MEIGDDIFAIRTGTIPKIGQKIHGSYSTDLEIMNIHLTIRDLFSRHLQEKVKNEQLVEKYNQQILKSSEKAFLISSREKILTLLRKYSLKNWKSYKDKVEPILKEYSQMSRKKKILVIGEKKEEKNVDVEEEKENERRLILIRQFLLIAKEFIEIDIVFEPRYKIGCDNCEQGIEEMIIDEEKGQYICSCNRIFGSVYSTETPHFDPERIEPPNRIAYDDKTNFIRRLKSYQGFQNKKLTPELLETLDQHMQKKYQLPPAEEIRKMELDKYGHRCSRTSVYLLKEALRETNNSAHFQDINSICYELWGWKPPQISHLVPKIIDDYIKTQEVYRDLNQTDSSINVELRLYWHLRAVGHDCLLEDFKIPQSRESKKRNSFIFKKMCEKTGLEFHSIIT